MNQPAPTFTLVQHARTLLEHVRGGDVFQAYGELEALLTGGHVTEAEIGLQPTERRALRRAHDVARADRRLRRARAGSREDWLLLKSLMEAQAIAPEEISSDYAELRELARRFA